MDSQLLLDLLIVVMCSLVLRGAEPLRITSVEIPKIVRAGTDEPVILDCKYDMELTSNVALVVKWYIKQNELLYQWIHDRRHRGSDEYRHYIDESYKASNDSNTMYRAVKLVKPSHELSGKVKCSISAQDAEVEATSDMLVYSPASVFRLFHPIINENSTRLTTRCVAEDLYPQPLIMLYRDNQPIENQKQFYENKSDGRFTAEVVANLWMNEIKLPTTFQCEVSIREANYTLVREIVYNGTSQSNVSLLISFITGFIITKATSGC
ncbi:uncharacterized protein [Chelonus insularis]|uniref:uncharacterized protein n=1 Tax=Chelonus insularis TaxID=460826 RepID=UPI00158E3BF8|nr:uncharacterized protein LOC118064679 [Chelonus insularis]